MLTCNLKSGYILQRRFLRFISYKYTTIIIFSLILNFLFGILFCVDPITIFLFLFFKKIIFQIGLTLCNIYVFRIYSQRKKGRKTLIFGTQQFIFNTYPSLFSTICFFGGFLSSAKIHNKLTK